MTTTTRRSPANRSHFYHDFEGVLTKAKRSDEILKESLDITNDLDGETISSTSWVEVSGPTISGTATSGASITWTITKAGYATLKVVTSGARELRYRFQWRSSDQGVSDYA